MTRNLIIAIVLALVMSVGVCNAEDVKVEKTCAELQIELNELREIMSANTMVFASQINALKNNTLYLKHVMEEVVEELQRLRQEMEEKREKRGPKGLASLKIN